MSKQSVTDLAPIPAPHRVVVRHRVTGELGFQWALVDGMPLSEAGAARLCEGIRALLPAIRDPQFEWDLTTEPVPVLDLAATVMRVDHLQPGQRIRYHGRLWVVHETMPVYDSAQWSVIAESATAPNGNGTRETLLYQSRTASAEVMP